ncbi:MAG: hypothetical protein JSS72_00665 [Armatimonadetes bacterium]|nr:hypothetical protein [Armatimonadota bacterium]
MKCTQAIVLALALGVASLAAAQGPYANTKDYSAAKGEAANPAQAKKDLAAATAEKQAAWKKYQKNPKAPGAAKTYAAAVTKLATTTMLSPVLDRKVKYRDALRLYREALKYDPTNKDAMGNKNMIESIYRSMGRPIPK